VDKGGIRNQRYDSQNLTKRKESSSRKTNKFLRKHLIVQSYQKNQLNGYSE